MLDFLFECLGLNPNPMEKIFGVSPANRPTIPEGKIPLCMGHAINEGKLLDWAHDPMNCAICIQPAKVTQQETDNTD